LQFITPTAGLLTALCAYSNFQCDNRRKSIALYHLSAILLNMASCSSSIRSSLSHGNFFLRNFQTRWSNSLHRPTPIRQFQEETEELAKVSNSLNLLKIDSSKQAKKSTAIHQSELIFISSSRVWRWTRQTAFIKACTQAGHLISIWRGLQVFGTRR
jgi:hypothetical protein